jgi:hypothetical protein
MLAPPVGLLTSANDLRDFYRQRIKTYARVGESGGSRGYAIRGHHLAEARVLKAGKEEGWVLEVEHEQGRATLTGAAAQRVLGRIMVAINNDGGTDEDLDRAVDLLGRYDGANSFLHREARAADWRRGRRYWFDDSLVGAIKNRAPSARLALETALHESVERDALEGEMQSLRDAWVEAEEIAAIADSL